MSDVERVGFVQKQGTTFTETVTVDDDAGNLIDLTNWTGRMQLRPTPSSTTVTYEANTANGGIVCGMGFVKATIPATALQSVLPSIYVYDIIVVSPDGVTVLPVRQGNFLVTPEISQPGTGGTVLVPTRLTVSPTTMSLTGALRTAQITPTVLDQNNNPMSGQTVTYSTSDATKATVSSSGLVTAVAAGASVTITAQVAGTNLTATVAVTTQAAVAQSMTISPSPVALSGSQKTQQLTPTVTDEFGNALVGYTIAWVSNDTTHVTVSSAGLVTAVAGGGNVTVTATVNSQVSASVTVTTAAAVVTTLAVAPSPVALTGGAPTQQLTPTITDQYGNAIAGSVTWSSSDTAHVTVSSGGLLTGVRGGGAVTITATVATTSVSTTIPVTTAASVPTTCSISPAGPVTLTGGAPTQQLTATVADQFGSTLVGQAVTWASGDSAHVTVSGSGLATGVEGGGSVTITASVTGTSVTGTVTINTAAAVATTVTLSPAGSVDLPSLSTVTVTPTVRDQFGAVMSGQTVTWASSNSGGITAVGGVLQAILAAQTATITATCGSASANLTATTDVAAPASIAVSPTGTLSVSTTHQITATVKDQYSNVMTGQSITWTSTDTAHVTVSSSGLVTAIAGGGTATVAASINGLSASLTITTPAAAPTTVVLSPAGPLTLATTAPQTVTATVKDQYGNAMTGQTLTWASTNSSGISVSSSGVVTAVLAGQSATITATDGSAVGTLSASTNAAVATSLAISPNGTVTLPNLNTVTITPTVKDQYGNVMGGQTITWSSSDSTGVTVTSSGVLQAVRASKTVTITATDGALTATLTAQTNAAVLTSLTTTPASVNSALGTLGQIGVNPRDQYTQPYGVATAFTISPTTTIALIALGQTANITAILVDQFGAEMLGPAVTWSSSDTAHVSVTASGQIGTVTAVAAGGNATITAACAGFTAHVTVTTITASYTLSISPSGTVDLPNLTPVAITATVTDQFGVQVTGDTITYTSSNASGISVSAAGVLQAINGSQTATITVTDTTRSLTQTLTATTDVPVPNSVISFPSSVNTPLGGSGTLIASTLDQYGQLYGAVRTPTVLTLAPNTLDLVGAGATQTLVPTVLDQTGKQMAGQTVTYASSATGVATVTTGGAVTAVAGGTATITGTCSGVTGTCAVTVQIVTSITVSPSTASLTSIGATQQLTAAVKDQSGNPITGQTITWSSSATGVATVSSAGLVTEATAGSAVITAAIGSVNGSATITCSTTGGGGGSGSPNEPSGMTTVINTGNITNTPATGGQNGGGAGSSWTQGINTWTDFSPTTKSSTGEWSGNLGLAPDGGWRLNYDATLNGGYSPVRFGAPYSTAGSGWQYFSADIRLSINWTLTGGSGSASGLKLCEPRTVNNTTTPGENHVINAGAYGGIDDGTQMWWSVFLQFVQSGGTTLSGIVPGNAAGQADSSSYYLSPKGNLGGAARGSYHKCEALFQPETTPGEQNAVLTLWVDGTMVFTTAGDPAGTWPTGGTHFFQAGDPNGMGWNYLMFDPTFGGAASTTHPPAAQDYDINNIYVSVK